MPPPDVPPPDVPPPLEPPGCLGVALELDGATYASVQRLVDNDLTLEAWIRTTQSLPGVNAGMGRIVFDGDIVGMGDNDDFAATVVSDTFGFAVGNPNTSVLGLVPVTTGAWVHVAATRQAGNGAVQIIINGELQGAGAASNRNPLVARPDLAFGGFSTMRKFIGTIDEIKVWNIVRSVEQISANMRRRPDPAEAGLVGYYSFEDQGPQQTADGSSFANTAALTGNPVYVPSSALCNPPAP